MLARKEKLLQDKKKFFRAIAYCQTSFHTHNDSKCKAFFKPQLVVSSILGNCKIKEDIYTPSYSYANLKLCTFSGPTHFDSKHGRTFSCKNYLKLSDIVGIDCIYLCSLIFGNSEEKKNIVLLPNFTKTCTVIIRESNHIISVSD